MMRLLVDHFLSTAASMGSPGMEGDRVDSYDVLALHHDGSTSVWASY